MELGTEKTTITVYLPIMTLRKIDKLRKNKSRNSYICDIVVEQIKNMPEEE